MIKPHVYFTHAVTGSAEGFQKLADALEELAPKIRSCTSIAELQKVISASDENGQVIATLESINTKDEIIREFDEEDSLLSPETRRDNIISTLKEIEREAETAAEQPSPFYQYRKTRAEAEDAISRNSLKFSSSASNLPDELKFVLPRTDFTLREKSKIRSLMRQIDTTSIKNEIVCNIEQLARIPLPDDIRQAQYFIQNSFFLTANVFKGNPDIKKYAALLVKSYPIAVRNNPYFRGIFSGQERITGISSHTCITGTAIKKRLSDAPEKSPGRSGGGREL